MPHPARLVTTLAAPWAFSGADAAPRLESWPTSRLLVQQGDTELIVRKLTPRAPISPVRFPAPWPRRFGSCAVSPAADLAVFAGPHALRAVDRSGNVCWELRHRCWAGCAGHTDFTEYADDRDHRYTGSGSTGFSADGKIVWAHVRGPLAGEAPEHDRGEEWLVIDAGDGTVPARTQTRTAAAGSVHVPHPDPGQMGLTIGEGQDGSPLRWGRWDGHTLTVDSFDDEDRVLLAVSPSGDRLLIVTHDQAPSTTATGCGPVARSSHGARQRKGSRPGPAGGKRSDWGHRVQRWLTQSIVAIERADQLGTATRAQALRYGREGVVPTNWCSPPAGSPHVGTRPLVRRPSPGCPAG